MRTEGGAGWKACATGGRRGAQAGKPALLGTEGLKQAIIVASGDMNEDRIAELLAAGAPIDMWGVGTDLVTSRAAPVVNGVYKLVAVERGGRRVPVRKLSQGKVTYPDAKQIYRRRRRPEWYPVELSPRLQAESAALRKAGDEG